MTSRNKISPKKQRSKFKSNRDLKQPRTRRLTDQINRPNTNTISPIERTNRSTMNSWQQTGEGIKII